MAKYKNVSNTRSIEYSEPFITITTDEGSPFHVSFRVRPEDLPSIARDLLDSVKGDQPPLTRGTEFVADDAVGDDVLIYIAWRNLEAVRIRRERAAAKEDEESEQRKQLEADALKYMNAVLQSDFTEFSNDTARDYWVDELVFSRKKNKGTA